MAEPKRIQRKRANGWRMPEGAVYVGRGSKWGNPFVVAKGSDPAPAVRAFGFQLRHIRAWYPVPGGTIPACEPTTVDDVRRELRGRDLACWCALDRPCHADVLLELANQQEHIP